MKEDKKRVNSELERQRDELREFRRVLARLKDVERERRLRESSALSPEYDYLEIDEDGYLLIPYSTNGKDTYTYDKVLAAGMELGKEYMKLAEDQYGFLPLYKAINEINARVGRKPSYDNKAFVKEMERVNNFMDTKGVNKL